MHQFFLAPEKCRGQVLQLDGSEAHHALHVLRLQPGDAVTVLDGAGKTYQCAVETAGKKSLTLKVREQHSVPPPPCSVTLNVAVPKGKIIEDIIEKAVELGVQRIVPLMAERVVMHLDAAGAEAKRERWQQVAVEAIKQCGQAWLPHVATPCPISEYLAKGEKPELALVGSLQTERKHPREWILEYEQQAGRLPASVAVWIGPEGDFTLKELQAIEAHGARPITLGELTLRVETAAVYCVSFLNYELKR